MFEAFDQEYITGVMVQYYISCHRELWFFSHKINMNREDPNIRIGKRIHQESYSREKKDITIGPVSFDFTKDEVKKSRKLTKPAKYQLYYYLWFLDQQGIEAEGVLTYPTERRREKIELTEGKKKEIEEIIKGIKEIVGRRDPPPPRDKPYCKGCSYFEFCKV
jgi:CRISPR-associated exonuclease Cas4